MSLALVCGAGVGVGLVLIRIGLVPPRPTLAELLARRAGAAPILPPAPPSSRSARPVSALARVAPIGVRTRRHLALCGRSVERHAAEKVALAVMGAALAPATAAVMALGGVGVALSVPAWASLALGVGGFVLPDLGVRAEAAARRRDLRHALGSFLDLVVISLAGGAGVEGALEDAAEMGRGWAFDQLRAALVTARATRQTPWAGLARLGEQLGVTELGELAASVSLAGSQGARVRASLAAKAQTLRAHLLADAETQAQAATERMSLPVVVLFAGFLIFVGYPALDRVLTGL